MVTSDSRGSAKLASFAKAAPGQIVEVGIAEQNLVGVAAGLAAAGKKVFAVSPACFLTARSLEQIKNDLCYSDRPVKAVGISAGVSYGALGTTHHSLHDYAVLRAIHNIVIVAPADNFETREAVRAAVQLPKPVYLRFGKKRMPHLPRVDSNFELGRASLIREGADLSFLACGETVAPAYEAAELLAKEGIQCRVLSLHTVKPLDGAAVRQRRHRNRRGDHGGGAQRKRWFGRGLRRIAAPGRHPYQVQNRGFSGRSYRVGKPGGNLPPLRS